VFGDGFGESLTNNGTVLGTLKIDHKEYEMQLVKKREMFQHNTLSKRMLKHTAMGYNIYIYVLTKINPMIIDDYVQIDCKDFLTFLNTKKKFSKKEIYNAAYEIAEKNYITVFNNDGKPVILSLFSIIEPDEESGIITVKISNEPRLRQYIFYSKNFTVFNPDIIMSFESKYSRLLYENLKSEFGSARSLNKNLMDVDVIYDVDVFKKWMNIDGVKRYDRASKVASELIINSVNEINALSDLDVVFAPVKFGKAIKQFRFVVKQKEVAETEEQRLLLEQKRLQLDYEVDLNAYVDGELKNPNPVYLKEFVDYLFSIGLKSLLESVNYKSLGLNSLLEKNGFKGMYKTFIKDNKLPEYLLCKQLN